MDKKKIFQKQLLQSKLKENINILLNYQKLYDELVEKSNANTADTIISTSDSKIKINLLLEQKNSYEKENKIKKNKINELLINVSQLEQEIHLSPINTKKKIDKEETIYNDEKERIYNDTIENINNNIETINSANIDKENLKKEIDLLKTNIEKQTNIISKIQIQCHSSRKNILFNLKENKKIKLELNNNINNLNTINNNFIEKNNNLIIDTENLIEFKKLLVDAEYNDYPDSNIEKIEKIEKLTTYFEKYNIDNSLSLNEILNLIDTILNTNKNQTLLVQKQQQNVLNLNNELINNNLNIYNKTSKDKIITHKDKFKLEKEKQSELESILDTKQTLYNNYQSIVIDKINNNFQNKITELEQDSINCIDRLNIIKIRLDLENEKNKIVLTNKIDNNKLELQKLYLDISNNTNECKILTTKIEKEKVISNEISILENNIKKYKEIINLCEKDLLSISQ